jgi:hypothetical protein
MPLRCKGNWQGVDDKTEPRHFSILSIGVAIPPAIRIVGKQEKRFSKSLSVEPRPVKIAVTFALQSLCAPCT